MLTSLVCCVELLVFLVTLVQANDGAGRLISDIPGPPIFVCTFNLLREKLLREKNAVVGEMEGRWVYHGFTIQGA